MLEDILRNVPLVNFILLLAIVAAIILVIKKQDVISYIFKVDESEVEDLRSRIVDLEHKIVALELTIHVLIEKLSKATGTPVQVPATPLQFEPLNRPVLLVYGDSGFGEADRNAMRRAGISFFRLISSSLEDLRTELHRRRSDGRMYDIVHISAHGGEGQINLTHTVVSGLALSDVLSGVRCVFLGTCSNQGVADKLIGIVQYVVVVYEDIQNTDAADFTYEFYRHYKEFMDIEKAFSEALKVMPQISEFVDLRKRG